VKIDDNHLYHRAAPIQIAEDPHFTAINGLGVEARHATRVTIRDGQRLQLALRPIPR